jgi:RNA recognition motif-containing protein
MATRIYVGNLPYTVDNDQLAWLFRAFGDVVEATVVIDRGTGQSKGFGFVEMADAEAARKAIDGLNGTMVGNRTIRVNEAQPRTERGGGSRYGGYGERPSRGYDRRDSYTGRGYRDEETRGYSATRSREYTPRGEFSDRDRGYNRYERDRHYDRDRRRDW